MTRKELENQVVQWYQQSPDYVMLFTGDWQLVWKNQPCPMLEQVDNYPAYFQLPDSAPKAPVRTTIIHGGELYPLRLTVHPVEEAQVCYLVRIDATSCNDAMWGDLSWCQEAQNQCALIRDQVFGTSNAVSALYSLVEETCDAYSKMLMDDMMRQLNIIQGNCSKMMRPALCLQELCYYSQKECVTSVSLFLDRELTIFMENCRNVLGRVIRMQVDADPYLRVDVNRDRLVHCLLFLIVLLWRRCRQMTDIIFQAKEQEDGIRLTVTAEQHGEIMDFMREKRHTEHISAYDTPLHSIEEQAVCQFCKTYGAKLFSSTTTTQKQASYTILLQRGDPEAPIVLHDFQDNVRDDIFSPYHLMLSEISSYRYY